MNIQRFTAATSREALAKARMAFGDGTLILSNRPIENGVEVVATGEDSLAALDQSGFSGSKQQPQPRNAEPSVKQVSSAVEEDADQLAMSTLSFQDYVRERMARRRQEENATDNSPASKLIRIPPDHSPAQRPHKSRAPAPRCSPLQKKPDRCWSRPRQPMHRPQARTHRLFRSASAANSMP